MLELVDYVEAWHGGDTLAGEKIITHEYINNIIEARVVTYPPQYQDDLRQEAYYHLLRRLRKQSFTSGTSREHTFSQIVTYVLKCAKYDVYQHFMRKIKYATSPKILNGKIIPIEVCNTDDYEFVDGQDVELTAIFNVSSQEIRQIVEELPHPIHRRLIIGYYFEYRTFVELGKELNLKRSNISRYHVDALRKLRDRLAEYSDVI